MNDVAEPLDPRTSDPRAIMQSLLPAARAEYIRAWEFLADPQTPLERRRVARTRAASIAADHEIVASTLRAREPQLRGDDLHNLRHLAGELERHAAALNRMATISVVGLTEAKDLRPEALGCGRRYRDPAKRSVEAAASTGNPRSKRGAGTAARDAQQRARREDRPFADRGPKIDRGQLGTSKHDSQLGDDLDPETRAKLEAMRSALEQTSD